MMNSHIDLLIRLKNSTMAKKDEIIVSFSKMNINILKKLKELKYIEDYLVEKKNIKKINIKLRYENNEPAITDIKIYSKPGKRIYFTKNDLNSIKRVISTFLISTSKGIMTNKEAKNKNIGGELLFEIW